MADNSGSWEYDEFVKHALGTPYNNTGRTGYRQCFKCGAIIGSPDAQEDHYRFHLNMVPREEASVMSKVNWCDIGDHAFRANEPGSQTMTVQHTDDDGRTVTEAMDVCGMHSMTPARMKAKALTATTVELGDE